jgi:two-component system response regulator
MIDDVILLVEDNVDDITMTMRAFQKNKIDNRIVIAHDGVEALDLLLPTDGADPLRPVLVLLDLNMPRIGGIEVLRRLRADPTTRTLPVIVMTTSDEERDITESYEIGANSYIRKPVASHEFLEATKALSMYWLMVSTLPHRGRQTQHARPHPKPATETTPTPAAG